MKNFYIEKFEIGIGCKLEDVGKGKNKITTFVNKTKEKLFYKIEWTDGDFCWVDVLTNKKYHMILKVKAVEDAFDLSNMQTIFAEDAKTIAKIVELVQDFDKDRPKIKLNFKHIQRDLIW
ncbi:MAG: hypothetical protein WCR30_00640 [Clostridia bacterium]